MPRLASFPVLVAMCGVLVGFAERAAAQSAQETPVIGWTLTPSITTGGTWDDNVLVQGLTDAPSSDEAANFAPAGSISYTGRKSEFSGAYNGGFTMYRSFPALNSYQHSARLSAKRRLSAHTTFSVYQSYANSPTTELQSLVGIPFVRLGSRMASVGAGMTKEFSKRTSVSAAYGFDWVRFDKDPVLNRPLVGGQSHLGRLGFQRALSRRIAATVDYDTLRATLASGGAFSVQNLWLGGTYRVTESTSIYGRFGLARLNTSDLVRPQTMPAWRAGVARPIGRATVDLQYGRTFVPSYAGGGTQANQELTLRASLPLGRRLYTQFGTAWRRDRVIFVIDELPLTSVWLSGAVGYPLTPWMRTELFYSGLMQRINRPGGAINRNQVGISISTGKPVRIR